MKVLFGFSLEKECCLMALFEHEWPTRRCPFIGQSRHDLEAPALPLMTPERPVTANPAGFLT
jgi:hypothetical protein